jgi:hypothetical protein
VLYKIYNPTNSIARFKKKNVFDRCENVLAYHKAGVVAVNLNVVGLAQRLLSAIVGLNYITVVLDGKLSKMKRIKICPAGFWPKQRIKKSMPGGAVHVEKDRQDDGGEEGDGHGEEEVPEVDVGHGTTRWRDRAGQM